MKYELIDHTADIGIQVFGKDPEDLFATAALAMFDQIIDGQMPGGNRKQYLNIRRKCQ